MVWGIRMKEKKRGHKSLQLTDKKHPGIAIGATLVGISSTVLFIATCFLSSESHGNAGITIGFAGIFCFGLALVGFGMSWASLRMENIRPLFPTVSSIINGLLLVFYMLLYIVGTFI